MANAVLQYKGSQPGALCESAHMKTKPNCIKLMYFICARVRRARVNHRKNQTQNHKMTIRATIKIISVRT